MLYSIAFSLRLQWCLSDRTITLQASAFPTADSESRAHFRMEKSPGSKTIKTIVLNFQSTGIALHQFLVLPFVHFVLTRLNQQKWNFLLFRDSNVRWTWAKYIIPSISYKNVNTAKTRWKLSKWPSFIFSHKSWLKDLVE